MLDRQFHVCLCALLLLAVANFSFAKLDCIYKNNGAWNVMTVDNNISVKASAANNPGPNNGNAPKAVHAGTMVVTQTGSLAWITGTPAAGFTVDTIDPGPYADVACSVADQMIAVGPSGADVFNYNAGSSTWVKDSSAVVSMGTGHYKSVKRILDGWGLFGVVIVDDANAVYNVWTHMPDPVSPWGPELIAPAAANEIVTAFAPSGNFGTLVYADGSVKIYSRGSGADWVNTGTKYYDIPASDGIKLVVQDPYMNNLSIFAITGTDYGYYSMSWSGSPVAYVKNLDITGRTYVLATQTAMIGNSETAATVIFAQRNTSQIDVFSFDTGNQQWMEETALASTNYSWLGEAGTAGICFASSPGVPVTLSRFSVDSYE